MPFAPWTAHTGKRHRERLTNYLWYVPQRQWTGEVGDTLRAVLTAPVPWLNQTEPLFDVLRIREQDLTGMLAPTATSSA